MTKPWEETWSYAGGNVYAISYAPTHGQIKHAEYAFPDQSRAKLAAQAPAMARLLYDLWHEWEHGYGSGLSELEIARVLKAAGVLP